LANAEGIGMVEGWRGEIISYVHFDDQGLVARFFPRDPSWLTWPTLEQMIHGNIVPDFPVCNKSVNGSYSGHDL
jgi:Ni,Fe-hydrogenase III large subunit